MRFREHALVPAVGTQMIDFFTPADFRAVRLTVTTEERGCIFISAIQTNERGRYRILLHNDSLVDRAVLVEVTDEVQVRDTA
jgi:hypothetical protein